MSKRTADDDDGSGATALKGGSRPMEVDGGAGAGDKEMGDFEDEFEDEFEEEDEVVEAGVDGRPDAEREAAGMDVDAPGTFIVGRTKLEPGQVLSPDPSAYDMLHSLHTPWPCLSFDIVRDQLGDGRTAYPATMYTVAGTQAQASKAGENELLVLKFSGLSRMAREDDGEGSDSDDDGDDDDAEESEPILESRAIPLRSTTNRIRTHQVASADPTRAPTTLTATMTEAAQVLIHDITPHLAAFDTPGAGVTAQQNRPVATVRAHRAEGYAVDWSPLHPAGKLLTGDNAGAVFVTTRTDGGGFVTDTRAFAAHAPRSVEDLQWSPSEASVFASASSDGTVRVWDVRSKSRQPAITVAVSAADVNVISWSRQTTHLLASGADDGTWAVWDLRQWKPAAPAAGSSPATPVASFGYHKEQITSIEWHPSDDSIVAVGAGDSTVTLWDLAVELDDEESRDTAGVQDVPPQLLFVHYHANVKEVHWHPQMPGALVATGDEFSIFKTISV